VTCTLCGGDHPANLSRCPVTGGEIGGPAAGLRPGQNLDGKYKIVREIGRGAMGVVYEGLHVALGRRIAIKTLRQDISIDADLASRFQREARAASAIGHPHIIDVFDLGRTPDGLLFMVMELLDGKSLATMLQETPRVPVPLAVNLITQVLGGLSAAHKHGIVHRDLKPDNIFIINTEDRPNFVKIVDFGIAKSLATRKPGQAGAAAMTGTMVGTVMGTPLYMAPEQAIGQVEKIDPRTDLHAVGAVLYEMLCGRTPYQGMGYAAILGSILDGRFPMPRALRPDVPVHIEAAIVRALDRDMDKRFPSAAAMREAIAGGPVEVTPPPVSLAAPSVVAATTGPALSLKLATIDGQEDAGPAFSLLENVPPPQAPAVGPNAASPRAGGADRFAPPPEQEAPLELGGTRWGSAPPSRQPAPVAEDPPARPPARASKEFMPQPVRRPRTEDPGVRAASVPAPREIEPEAPGTDEPPVPLVERPQPRPAAVGTVAPERLFSLRTRRILIKLGMLLLLVMAGRVAYHFWQVRSLGLSGGGSTSGRGPSSKVALLLDPADTNVQIDHIPTSRREVELSAGAPHQLNATAPGRVTRRFSFKATAGLKLVVRMSHLLAVPSPLDPPPVAAELSMRTFESARSSEEVDGAMAKLDKVAQCLATAGDESGSDKPGARARLHGEDLARCKSLVHEAHGMAPAMAALESAADAYLAAVQSGQKLETVTRAGASLRAELLAERSAWQWEELALQEKMDGRKAAWHMRRVTMAAYAWLRSMKANPPAPQTVSEQASALNDSFNAFLAYAEDSRDEMARMAGANDFMKAAQETVAVARPGDGKPRSEFAALSACRRLVNAFNVTVTE
jgi:serine/threonine protein kinase